MFPNTWANREKTGQSGYQHLQGQSFCWHVQVPDLHANDGIDKEEHSDEQANVWESFKGLDEGPQENPDRVALSQQLDEPGCSEQLQEAHVELIDRLGQRAKGRKGMVDADAVVENTASI